MSRSFNKGRASDLMYNKELYELYEALKHVAETQMKDSDGNPLEFPETEKEGSVWLNRLKDGEIFYFKNGQWNMSYKDKFRLIDELLSPTEPYHPVVGQLWLNAGQLFCWNGVTWQPIVTAQASDSNEVLRAYEDFLMISPLLSKGSVVLEADIWQTGTDIHPEYNGINAEDRRKSYWPGDIVFFNGRYYECTQEHIPKVPFNETNWVLALEQEGMSQYLVPSTKMDKFFVNGKYTDNYMEKSNICIQYPLNKVQGTVQSAIHVNPKKITKIKKKLFYIDKANPIINCSEANTEYYAFYNGVGRLLVKTNDYRTDYKSTPTGIKLSQKVADVYDFVMTITYSFANSREKGALYRNKVFLDDSNKTLGFVKNHPITVNEAGSLFVKDNIPVLSDDDGKLYIKVNDQSQEISVNTDPNGHLYATIESEIDNPIDSACNSIYIGKTEDPIAVFLQGYYLEESYVYDAKYGEWKDGTDYEVGAKVVYNKEYYRCVVKHKSSSKFDDDAVYWEYVNAQITYTYDQSTGYITLPIQRLPKEFKQPDVVVLTFPRIEKGSVKLDSKTKKTYIQLDSSSPEFKPFKKPLIFVAGESLTDKIGVPDYTYDSTLNRFWVENAKEGMLFAVCESDCSTNMTQSNMFVKTGVVEKPASSVVPASIPCNNNEIPQNIKPIIFVDGLLVSLKDIYINGDGSFSMNGLTPGQGYTLLADIDDRRLFDDIVNFVMIPLKDENRKAVYADDVIVYIEDNVICDTKTVLVSSLPTKAGNGEVKLLIKDDKVEWYMYNERFYTWNKIIDPKETDAIKIAKAKELILKLKGTTVDTGYTSNRRTISILNDFSKGAAKQCTYFAYKYANSIEEPLRAGNLFVAPNTIDCRLHYQNLYTYKANSLSVWINGVRQYYINENQNCRDFEIPAINDPRGIDIFYVVERPEQNDEFGLSCQRDIVNTIVPDPNDSTKEIIIGKVDGCFNMFKTNLSLFPGNVRVFVGGLRLPAKAFTIVDEHTFIINQTISGSKDDSVLNYYDIKKNGVIESVRPVQDEILIEVRQDYDLKEYSVEAKPGQQVFSMSNDDIPESLIETNDFVMIYVNGFAYGKEYIIDKDSGIIKLLNRDVTSCLGFNPNKKDIVTFEWR